MNKRLKLIFFGAVSLVVFGFLLPQPLQALLVVIDSPLKKFFLNHALSLCIVVGAIQGISEECGYFFVLKRISKNEPSKLLPFWFGFGRSLLHTLFDLGTVLTAFSSVSGLVFSIVSRMFSFAALMKLTKLDYLAGQTGKTFFLGFSVLLHAVLNGTLYASELRLFHAVADFETWFLLVYSVFVIGVSSILCSKGIAE